MMSDGSANNEARRSPLRIFLVSLLVSAAALVILAFLIGWLGLGLPIDPTVEDATQLNLQLWSLVIASVVAIAGSITAVFIAHAANQAQQDALRLQQIEAYHNDPAFSQAQAIRKAATNCEAILQLIVTGLQQSHATALLTSAADASPTINRWKSFSAALNDAVLRSDLYTFLLSRRARNTSLVPWSVATLLSSADDLSEIAARHTNGKDQTGEEAFFRAAFSRNALSVLAASTLLDEIQNVPSAAVIFEALTGTPSPAAVVARANVAEQQGSRTALSQTISQLASEMVSRAQKITNMPVWTVDRTSSALAHSLRGFFNRKPSDDNQVDRDFTPWLLVDYDIPYVSITIDKAARDALEATPAGPHSMPGIAYKVVHVENLIDFAGLCAPSDTFSVENLRTLPDLLPAEAPILNATCVATLDALSRSLLETCAETFFVIHMHSPNQHAAMAYVASRMEKALLVWHGWPLLPNNGLAIRTFVEEHRFSRAGIESDGFSVNVPLVICGVLSDSMTPTIGRSAETLRGISMKRVIVSDIGL